MDISMIAQLATLAGVLLTPALTLFKQRKALEIVEQRLIYKYEDLAKDVKTLMKSYEKNENYNEYLNQMNSAVDAAKDYLKKDELLVNFAIYKSGKFIKHSMGSLPRMRADNIDYIYEQGKVQLGECKQRCAELFGETFCYKYYQKHDEMAEKYSREVAKIIEAGKKYEWNDIERSVFIESLKFMQNFLRLLHDIYYNDYEDLMFYS